MKGLLHIYTGDGKGKTTASVGLTVRAAGQGIKVLFAQFFKCDGDSSGEKNVFDKKLDNVDIIRSNSRHPFFTGRKTDEAAVAKSVAECFNTVKEKVKDGNYGMVVMDEFMAAINGGFISINEALEFISSRPEGIELVLTGRDAPVEIVKVADYVTEMLMIKHPFASGMKARKGIEF